MSDFVIFAPRVHLISPCICVATHCYSSSLAHAVVGRSEPSSYPPRLDDWWHGSVAPRLALVDAVAGADGFGCSDVDGF